MALLNPTLNHRIARGREKDRETERERRGKWDIEEPVRECKYIGRGEKSTLGV